MPVLRLEQSGSRRRGREAMGEVTVDAVLGRPSLVIRRSVAMGVSARWWSDGFSQCRRNQQVFCARLHGVGGGEK
jgi:hypothetical protein